MTRMLEMNASVKFWSVILVLSSAISVFAANNDSLEENKVLRNMIHQVPLSHFKHYHSHDWEEFMEISHSHWGDSTHSLIKKFDSILGEKGKFTNFYSEVFKDKKSVLLFKQAYIEIQCGLLITHFNAHSRNSVSNWFRYPYEIDVITKLETYALKNEIPLLRYYHQELGYNESHFIAGVEKMNEELLHKLQEQEEKETRVRLELEDKEIKKQVEVQEKERLSKIPPPPPRPPLIILTGRIKTPLSSSSRVVQKVLTSDLLLSEENTQNTLSRITKKGAIPTLSSAQLQEVITKKLKHVRPEDLIKPILSDNFAALLYQKMESRRKVIKDDDETDEEE